MHRFILLVGNCGVQIREFDRGFCKRRTFFVRFPFRFWFLWFRFWFLWFWYLLNTHCCLNLLCLDHGTPVYTVELAHLLSTFLGPVEPGASSGVLNSRQTDEQTYPAYLAHLETGFWIFYFFSLVFCNESLSLVVLVYFGPLTGRAWRGFRRGRSGVVGGGGVEGGAAGAGGVVGGIVVIVSSAGAGVLCKTLHENMTQQ